MPTLIAEKWHLFATKIRKVVNCGNKLPIIGRHVCCKGERQSPNYGARTGGLRHTLKSSNDPV
jgi:hypothetical protein